MSATEFTRGAKEDDVGVFLKTFGKVSKPVTEFTRGTEEGNKLEFSLSTGSALYRLVVVVDKAGGSGVVVPATFGIADVMAVVAAESEGSDAWSCAIPEIAAMMAFV